MGIKRTKIVDALGLTNYGSEINVKGWVRTKRGNKNVSFIALNDGSTIKNIQLVVDAGTIDENILKDVTTANLDGKRHIQRHIVHQLRQHWILWHFSIFF